MQRGTPSRREFFTAMGLTPAAAALEAAPRASPRALEPTGSDLGSLLGEVESIASASRPAYSFLGDRFRTLADFRAAARDKVFELLLYNPEKVDPKAQVVERVDRGDHVREKVLFFTPRDSRVPAYLLLPPSRSGRAPP